MYNSTRTEPIRSPNRRLRVFASDLASSRLDLNTVGFRVCTLSACVAVVVGHCLDVGLVRKRTKLHAHVAPELLV